MMISKNKETATNQKKRKVLHVVEATRAGVGKHVVDLTAWQAENDTDVHVIYNTRDLDQNFTRALEANHEIKWTGIDIPRSPNVKFLKVVRLIRKYIEKEGVQIVHGHSSIGGAIARLSSFHLRVRVIYTPNAFLSMDPRAPKLKKIAVKYIERMLSHITTVIIAVSIEEEQHFQKEIKGRCEIHVVNNGISAAELGNRDSIRRSYGLKHEDVVVGYVGRLDHQKAPLDLVKTMIEVVNRDDSFKLMLIGDGLLKINTEDALKKSKKLANRTTRIDYANGQQIMAAFDIFVLPSIYEGFPYVVLEAMSNGLPIVTTHESCVKSSVKHGVNGFVTNAGNITALTNHILDLIQNSALRESMGIESAKIISQFSIQNMGQKVCKIYDECI